MMPKRLSTDLNPWKRLVAVRPGMNQTQSNDSAPPGFSTRVVTDWLRLPDDQPAAVPGDFDVWELLGMRAALATGVLALALATLNFSTLREFVIHLDSVVLDPTALLVGPSL